MGFLPEDFRIDLHSLSLSTNLPVTDDLKKTGGCGRLKRWLKVVGHNHLQGAGVAFCCISDFATLSLLFFSVVANRSRQNKVNEQWEQYSFVCTGEGAFLLCILCFLQGPGAVARSHVKQLLGTQRCEAAVQLLHQIAINSYSFSCFSLLKLGTNPTSYKLCS